MYKGTLFICLSINEGLDVGMDGVIASKVSLGVKYWGAEND
jgi:hypothetical protein